MKTKEELNEIKEEVEKLDKKLHELTEEELEQVTGGGSVSYPGVGIGKFALDEFVVGGGDLRGNLVGRDIEDIF